MGSCKGRNLLNLLQLFIAISCFSWRFSSSADTITFTQPISDPDTIVSSANTFRFGFFNPKNTTNRYVGVMYDMPEPIVVWVANRDTPLQDMNGIVAISEDGNLVILDGNETIVWSSNISSSLRNSSAQLLDDGNLVLRDDTNGRIVWESFLNPTNSFLQGMRLSANRRTHNKTLLRSWRSPNNPSVGNFSAGLVTHTIPQLLIWNNGQTFWRSGPWNGQLFTGILGMTAIYLNRFMIVDDNGTLHLSFTSADDYVLYNFLSPEGAFVQKQRLKRSFDWELIWSSLQSQCDVYGNCGPFGSCSPKDSPVCTCLPGYEPTCQEEWARGNWTSGCKRKAPLLCETTTSVSLGNEGKQDGFWKLQEMKVPDFPQIYHDLQDTCESQCLTNCSCIAYSFFTGIGCMLWSENLIDIQKFFPPDEEGRSTGRNHGADLCIRLANSELESFPVNKKDKKMNAITISAIVAGSVAISMCFLYLFWKCLVKRRGMRQNLVLSGEWCRKFLKDGTPHAYVNQVKLEELPLFGLKELANATNNFDSNHKLGQGGFGPVYKGQLPDGENIAVKMLSKSSGQGLEEFMNEVLVISKLQHRNLVKILGCCVEREEKILIYEYMPNKSLDAYIFGLDNGKSLDWDERKKIIEGIGRGLLYLHRDSRLRIIHRDLKASNILLDEQLNPKISDFGMARIFGGSQDQGHTRRVVGTYGYMAPEYVIRGRFSEKSDVYGFGVLLLEIVSGMRNTSFNHKENTWSLPGYAWKLWNEDNMLSLVNETIFHPGLELEFQRYLHIGLLCVQESATDRPNISTILSMLCSEIAELPNPKVIAFASRETYTDKGSSNNHGRYSASSLTLSNVEAR